MINEYRFFQEFFDGQIVKEDSEQYKLFKILLLSLTSVVGIFLVLMGWCSVVPFCSFRSWNALELLFWA